MSDAINKIRQRQAAQVAAAAQTSLGPAQLQLLKAWSMRQLPLDTSRFLRTVAVGLNPANRRAFSQDVVKQFSGPFARALLESGTPAGQKALLTKVIRNNSQALRLHADHLLEARLLSPEHHDLVRQALDGVSLGDPIEIVLEALPFKVAQQILNSRQEAMEQFFKDWAEDMAQNAELDKKAAEKNHLEQSEQKRLDEKSVDLKRAEEKVASNGVSNRRDNERTDGRRRNKRPRSTLLQRAVSVAVSNGYVGGSFQVKAPSQEVQAVSGDEVVSLIESKFNISLLDALDEPAKDIGAKTGGNYPKFKPRGAIRASLEE